MRFIRYFILLLALAAFPGISDAQPLKENEIVVIHGEKFVLHQVRTGETIYSITRQFQVGKEELISNNPQIGEGLKIGEILKIPYREKADLRQIPVSKKGDPAYFEYHTISSRTETPYFIAREYGITVEDVYSYNPEVSRFRKGIRLRIPRWDLQKQVSASPSREDIVLAGKEERKLIAHEVQPDETLVSLAGKYKIPESEILFFNPGARELKAGSTVYIPRQGDYQKPDGVAATAGHDPAEEHANTAHYFEHTIVSGETLWYITRKYDVSEEELKKINPALVNGFPAGTTIRIPVKEKDLNRAEPLNEDAFIKHLVQPGETLYGLALQYHLTVPEIRKFNPQLENRGLVQGELILIPKIPEKNAETSPPRELANSFQVPVSPLEGEYYKIELTDVIPENCKKQNSPFLSSATCDVALFLPLFLVANDTLNKRPPHSTLSPGDSLFYMQDILGYEKDSLVEMEEPEEMFHGFFRESENFLQFYEGVLLAVDSLQRAGMNIRLNVFDTQQSPEAIRKYIYSEQFLETDLIIGPVYIQVQDEVAAIAAKNQIPMVSPLSLQSEKLDSNPYYFQVNPTRDLLALKTSELIAEEYFNSNFVVVKTSHSGGSAEEKVVDLVREKMLHSGYLDRSEGMNFNTYDYSREGPSGFSSVLSREKENVVFVSSMNEGDLSVILSNMNNLAGEYPITLIGFNRYEQFQSISDEFFHNLKLHYVAPYWTDYQNPETIRFLNKFKSHFYMEPDNFGMQGYDVSFYFLSALMEYGKDFMGCLPYHQVHLAQGNYRFEKVSEYGGYMNQGVSVIAYRRDYDVVRKRVIGSRPFAQK